VEITNGVGEVVYPSRPIVAVDVYTLPGTDVTHVMAGGVIKVL
jgi:hypothetical protein